MRYILCQPSINRFKWELEVCITRLHKLGITDIILLFNKRDMSVPAYFEEMGVEVHVYDDSDRDKSYIPAIKPYLWSKYLKEDPEREKDCYFYMDSDVLVREVPEITLIEGTWIASDCSAYLGVDYIDSKGEGFLEGMCKHIGIDAEMIRKAKPFGGAQWVINNPTAEYWQKVYEDSVKLYHYLSRIGAQSILNNPKGYVPIQKWTAEMWAQLWNVYHFGWGVEVSEELDFSWPHDDISVYHEKKLFHNAGVTANDRKLFYKGKYVDRSPIGESFDHIDKSKASYQYVIALKEVAQMPKSKKYLSNEDWRDLSDDKEYAKDKPWPRPANKKVSPERVEELLSDKNLAGRPLIREDVDEE